MTLRLRHADGTVETFRDDAAGLDSYVRLRDWSGITLETGDGWPISYREAARRFLARGDATVDDDAAEEPFEHKSALARYVLAALLFAAILASMIGQAVGSAG